MPKPTFPSSVRLATAEYSKSEKKALRELAGTVYEAEARLALEELDSQFELWRQGSMLGSELIAAIHKFHQEDARALWSIYQAQKNLTSSRGLALGLVTSESVPESLRAKLEPLMAGFDRTSRLSRPRFGPCTAQRVSGRPRTTLTRTAKAQSLIAGPYTERMK